LSIDIYVPGFITTIMLLLRRTLQLLEFYSTNDDKNYADEHFTAFSAGCASQGTLIKDVKEDLKKNFFPSFKNIKQSKSLDERQIYGLTCICGNKAVTLPVRTNDL